MIEDQNMGSYGAPVGGAQALQEAMQRRGIDMSQLQQMSPSAPGGAAPMATGEMPAGGDLASAQAAMPQGAPQAPAAPPDPQNPELMSAIEALGGFVKAEGKTRQEVARARLQGLV